jgi:hypothetical protein
MAFQNLSSRYLDFELSGIKIAQGFREFCRGEQDLARSVMCGATPQHHNSACQKSFQFSVFSLTTEKNDVH